MSVSCVVYDEDLAEDAEDIVELFWKYQNAAPVIVVPENGRFVVLTPPSANKELGVTLIGPNDIPLVLLPPNGSIMF